MIVCRLVFLIQLFLFLSSSTQILTRREILQHSLKKKQREPSSLCKRKKNSSWSCRETNSVIFVPSGVNRGPFLHWWRLKNTHLIYYTSWAFDLFIFFSLSSFVSVSVSLIHEWTTERALDIVVIAARCCCRRFILLAVVRQYIDSWTALIVSYFMCTPRKVEEKDE